MHNPFHHSGMETSCKDVTTRVGGFALQFIFCAWGRGNCPFAPQMAPLILAHDFPVLDFYNSNICYCFMKCDNFNVKDDVVDYVVHLWCILPPKPRFRGHSVNTLNIDAAPVSATLVLLSGRVHQLPCSLSQSPQHSVGI